MTGAAALREALDGLLGGDLDRGPLTEWEADFVRDMDRRARSGVPSTGAQLDKLEEIARLRGLRRGLTASEASLWD